MVRPLLHFGIPRVPLLVGLFGLSLVVSTARAASEFNPFEYTPFEGRTVVDRHIINAGVTKEFVILRELEQQVDTPFVVETLRQDLVRLENLGIFSNVQVVVIEQGDDIVLEYHVTEMPWIVPYLSFRYNEENGWSIGPALTSFNLLGRDIALSGRVLFGGTSTFEAKLAWPWIAYDHLSLDLTLNHLVRTDEILEFEEKSYEFTPWIGHYLGRHGRIAGTAGWFQMNADEDGRTLSPDNQDNLVRIGLRLGYDSRDSWRNPRQGWQNEIEFMKVGGWLGGDGDYEQATLDVRRFESWGDRHSVFLGALSTISSGTIGEEFPPYFIFRMGGTNTIRGYDVKNLGKKLFGKNQMIYTAEYHFTLLPLRPYRIWRWSVSVGFQAALFADLGVAWSDHSELTWDRFKSGYGTGLRMLVPGAEAIRFDLGFSEDGDVRFHIGPWFRWTAQRLRLR